jgi:phosphate transport system substrate-binding protein
MKIHQGVKIQIFKTGTGQGIQDILSEKCQVAMISRPLTDDEIKSGVRIIPVAKDGVAPIVSQKNPYITRILKRGMSTDEFIRIFTGEKTITWGELLDTISKVNVVTFTRADESGAADIWADFLYKRSSDLRGNKVSGDEEMINSIRNNPYAIGFCNFSYAFDVKTGERKKDIQIVPFDLDFDNVIESKEVPFNNLEKAHRGLWLGLYPKSLCRELTIGTVGKPTDKAIIEFIKYTLTTGQDDVKIVGLCELNNVYIQYSLDQLK